MFSQFVCFFSLSIICLTLCTHKFPFYFGYFSFYSRIDQIIWILGIVQAIGDQVVLIVETHVVRTQPIWKIQWMIRIWQQQRTTPKQKMMTLKLTSSKKTSRTPPTYYPAPIFFAFPWNQSNNNRRQTMMSLLMTKREYSVNHIFRFGLRAFHTWHSVTQSVGD